MKQSEVIENIADYIELIENESTPKEMAFYILLFIVDTMMRYSIMNVNGWAMISEWNRPYYYSAEKSS